MSFQNSRIDLLSGRQTDSNATMRLLVETLIPKAVERLNGVILPAQIPIFPDDVTPTNQSNLTDVRTRIGGLLEYQFATAVNETLPDPVARAGIRLTHVVANQFPDLAFRSQVGELGVRLEMKAVQTVAEEKAANFDALIKDVRKGKDFVVVFTWEWEKVPRKDVLYPHIHEFYAMDAYQLAQMRDTYWLDTPPRTLGKNDRQGIDLKFAVNATSSGFNQEEGNFGKLMRIFDQRKEGILPSDLVGSETLSTYYRFKKETRRLGMSKVFADLSAKCVYAGTRVIDAQMPMTWLVTDGQRRLALLGDEKMPREPRARNAMQRLNVATVITMNKDFSWNAYRQQQTGTVANGTKPAPAATWAQNNW